MPAWVFQEILTVPFTQAFSLPIPRGEDYSESVRELTSCRSCHRNIAPDFRYCPYCGEERVRNYEFRQLLDEPFDRMERTVQEYSFQRLIILEGRLLDLETDLENLLAVPRD